MTITHQEVIEGMEQVTFTADDRANVRLTTSCEVSIRSRNNGPRVLRITGQNNVQVQLARRCVLEVITGTCVSTVAGSLALLWQVLVFGL